MFAEDDLLPISALQHLLFCPRQCALIHLEQVWAENQLTAQGRVLHERAHAPGPESRGNRRIIRGLRLRSFTLGLTGQADVVELRRPTGRVPPGERTRLHDLPGEWLVRPVEYKRGRPKQNDCDRVQLCAQALCLEEMMAVRISVGAIFYAQPRRRQVVPFDEPLRRETQESAERLHTLMAAGATPPAEYAARKCRACSLIDQCMPKSAGRSRSARDYLDRQLKQASASLGPESSDEAT
ncbi:MAG: hypothetical protein BIFFINMI_01850 [Phycisphaerae bacterium]|nr:hypothetical protein [Phycisphaerae bacterium]